MDAAHRDDPGWDFDDAPCGLVRTDAEGVILRANATFCRWVGWEAGELVGRRRLQDLFTMGGRIFHQTHWVPLLQLQGSVSEVKLELVHSDGHRFPVVLNALRRDRDGRTVHDVAAYVARDRDQYERELVESRRRLEAAIAESTRAHEKAQDRALLAEQMVGIVSHDLRNPLSTIAMGGALLQRQGVSPEQAVVLGRIGRATDRANRLISQLLDFTQARLGGGLQVTPRPIRWHATVHDCVEELALAFAGRTLRHERVGEDGECAADPDRLSQLVGNLVGNAMTYGEPGSPVVVTTRVGAADFGVAVHNQGTAIPPETIGAIFQPLARGRREGGGVGLGLYIVDQIVRAHGGIVVVRSNGLEGTTFTADFPRQAPFTVN